MVIPPTMATIGMVKIKRGTNASGPKSATHIVELLSLGGGSPPPADPVVLTCMDRRHARPVSEIPGSVRGGGNLKPDRAVRPSNRTMEIPSAPPGMERADERALIERARRSDQEAFRELVRRHRDRAYGLALRILRSPADAEEVAQDAFV